MTTCFPVAVRAGIEPATGRVPPTGASRAPAPAISAYRTLLGPGRDRRPDSRSGCLLVSSARADRRATGLRSGGAWGGVNSNHHSGAVGCRACQLADLSKCRVRASPGLQADARRRLLLRPYGNRQLGVFGRRRRLSRGAARGAGRSRTYDFRHAWPILCSAELPPHVDHAVVNEHPHIGDRAPLAGVTPILPHQVPEGVNGGAFVKLPEGP